MIYFWNFYMQEVIFIWKQKNYMKNIMIVCLLEIGIVFGLKELMNISTNILWIMKLGEINLE